MPTDRRNVGFGLDIATLAQLLRYGVVGLCVTMLGAAIYYGCAEFLHIAPLIANSIAWLVGIVVGYGVHSRISFRGQGERGDLKRTGTRFIVVNLIGYALNSFWVWLLVEWIGGANWWPVLPMILLTPLSTFLLHRHWTFG